MNSGLIKADGDALTPKVKIFENVFPAYRRDTELGYVLWPNLVKIGRCEVAERSSGLPYKKLKKLGLLGTRPSPSFWPTWADRAQNSLNVVIP